jgi:hypothetical protein
MPRDYDWDLESPVDDPLSVDRGIGPKYRDELHDLYRLFQVPATVDSEFDHSRDSERINEWEQMVELATYQFEAVPEVVEDSQEQAEKMFDTGEVLIYNLLDDFSDLHADYYRQFTSKRHNIDVKGLKDSYEEAYGTLENIDDSDFSDGDFGSARDSGIGGSIKTGDLGGDLGGGEL